MNQPWALLKSWWFILMLSLAITYGQAAEPVEIISVDQELSGRLYKSFPLEKNQESTQDHHFGDKVWQEFDSMDFFLGTFIDNNREVVVLCAFQIDEAFMRAKDNGSPVHLVFTICEDHSGEPENIFPIKIYSLKKNASSPFDAAMNPGSLIKELAADQFEVNGIYRIPIPVNDTWQAGDVVWFGLDSVNHLDGKSHSIILGGDRISFPGSLEPQLICTSAEWLESHSYGLSLLNSLQYQLRSPSSPEEFARSTKKWSHDYLDWGVFQPIELLESFRDLLQREIQQSPTIKHQLLHQERGFHSSIKKLKEGWQLTIPISGTSTCVALIPAQSTGSVNEIYGFPKRFTLKAFKVTGEEIIVADWSRMDFPVSTIKPYLFSYPYGDYSHLELEVSQGIPNGNEHYFALSEIITYTKGEHEPILINCKSSDQLSLSPKWHLKYLSDGIHPLGLPLSEEKFDEPDLIKIIPNNEPVSIDIVLSKAIDIHQLEIILANQSWAQESHHRSRPQKVSIELFAAAKDKDAYQTIIKRYAPQEQPQQNILRIPTKTMKCQKIHITLSELPRLDQGWQLGLAEIMYNHGQRLPHQKVSSRQLEGVNLEALTDGYAMGHQWMNSLQWSLDVLRRNLLEDSLLNVEKALLNVQQRKNLLIRRGIYFAITLVCIILLLWILRQGWTHQREKKAIRRRFQQDLHDEIGSGLSTIALICDQTPKSGLSSKQGSDIKDVHKCALESSASLREVIWYSEHGEILLGKCLSLLAQRSQKMLPNINLDLDFPRECPEIHLSDPFRRQLLLCFTECLHNIQKHSKATKVIIHAQIMESHLHLEIRDNGMGFRPTDEHGQGLGLSSMRERTQKLNGNFEISSEPENGTIVTLQLPLPS
ncbi:MAG: hypothetical protein HQL32_06360 [Planctomycetes bacterium]|nr:hypothetical protein [Planctomycetota bacterium]